RTYARFHRAHENPEVQRRIGQRPHRADPLDTRPPTLERGAQLRVALHRHSHVARQPLVESSLNFLGRGGALLQLPFVLAQLAARARFHTARAAQAANQKQRGGRAPARSAEPTKARTRTSSGRFRAALLSKSRHHSTVRCAIYPLTRSTTSKPRYSKRFGRIWIPWRGAFSSGRQHPPQMPRSRRVMRAA